MKTQEYNNNDEQIIDMLTPKVEVKPSSDLRERILQAAAQQSAQQSAKQAKSKTVAQPKRRITYWLGAIGSMAAVVAVAITMMVNTPAYAARKYFSNALLAVQDAKTMIMKLSVRTEADEPIDYINPEDDFIPATVKVIYNDPMLWCIEKQDGRTLLYKGADSTGDFVYQWIGGTDGKIGWKQNPEGYVEGDLAIMLDPRLLLQAEKGIAKNSKAAKYDILDNGELVIVRVTTTAQGNYSQSNYMMNTSLAEANTVRVYSFAKSTGELVQMRIDFVVDNKPITVIESQSIAYNAELTPADLSSKDLSTISFSQLDIAKSASSPLAGITADEAAKIILQAMKSWDKEILGTAMAYYKDFMPKLESIYKGLEVKSIEKSFSSGLYPGKFVKCKVVLADGKKETLTLALRNDNKNKVWLLDGGL